MSVIDKIYQAAITTEYGEDFVLAFIEYNNNLYVGEANLHPDDKDFYSKKVGRAIAISRARIKMLRDERTKAKAEARIKQQMIVEVFGKKEYDEADPTGLFEKNMKSALRRYYNLNKAYKAEKAYLNKYLDGQAKAIESVKRLREKKETDENN